MSITGGNLVRPRICSAASLPITIDDAFRMPLVIRVNSDEFAHDEFSGTIIS